MNQTKNGIISNEKDIRKSTRFRRIFAQVRRIFSRNCFNVIIARVIISLEKFDVKQCLSFNHCAEDIHSLKMISNANSNTFCSFSICYPTDSGDNSQEFPFI